MRKIFVFTLCMGMLCMAGVNLTLVWAAENGWQKIGESNGIVGYTRLTKNSVNEVKAIGIVDAPIAVVEAVIRDASVQPEYMYMCKEASVINTPDMKSDGDTHYCHNVTGMPFPVSNRDNIVKMSWSINKSTGTLYCRCVGQKTTYMLKQGVVRMPLMVLDYTLVPKGTDKTEITYQGMADPGGSVPSALVNMFTKNIGIKTIEGIRKTVLKDKFKNAKAVETITPHM